jgi:hypothetical protein
VPMLNEPSEAEKAAAAARRDAALSVACPECKRPAGARCITLDTHQPTNLVHRARVNAWQPPPLDGDGSGRAAVSGGQ